MGTSYLNNGTPYLDFLNETPNDANGKDIVDTSAYVRPPTPRATTGDGLTYTDDGSPTPLAIHRAQALRHEIPAGMKFETSFDPVQANRTAVAEGGHTENFTWDPTKGQYYSQDRDGRRVYITNNPVAEDAAANVPMLTAGHDDRASFVNGVVAQGRKITISPGNGTVPGRQATPQEAFAATQRYNSTGNSLPGPGQDYSSYPHSEETTSTDGTVTTGGPGTPKRPDAYRTDSVSDQVRQYLAQENQSGPSQAEALLNKATDRVAAQSLGIAAGARGGAAARERATRGAQASNVALGAEASSNIASLRAQEDKDRRARIQGLLSQLGSNASQGDARDLGYYESDNSANTALVNADAARQLSRDSFNAQAGDSFKEDPVGYLARFFGRPDPTPRRI